MDLPIKNGPLIVDFRIVFASSSAATPVLGPVVAAVPVPQNALHLGEVFVGYPGELAGPNVSHVCWFTLW